MPGYHPRLSVYPGASLHLPYPPDVFISCHLCLPVLWQSTFSRGILRMGTWEVSFVGTYMLENIFILPSYLINNLVDINSGMGIIFYQNSDPFLASNAAIEKSEAILLPDSLCVMCFSISPLPSPLLEVFELFFLC